MCSSVWTENWLDQYADLLPHRFVIARRNGRVCGVCLLTEGVDRRDGPLRLHSLHLGTAGEPEADEVRVEFNRLLVEPADRAEFVRQLLQRLSAESDWDELCLDGFTPRDAERFRDADPQFELHRHTSYYFDLRAARREDADAL